MLKGFLALFTTGIIFNPAILLGGLSGIVSYIFLDGEQLKTVYAHYHVYLLFFIFSAGYVYFLRPVLKDNARDTDWKATITSMIKETILMSFCFVMGMLLASFFDFSDLNVKQKSDDVMYSKIDDMVNLQENIDDLIKNEPSEIQKILQSQ